MRGLWIVASLCLVPSLRAGTWLVDDDGPADFPGIVEAIAALPAGETIVVQSGEYAPFALDKRMRIFATLGTERPHINGLSVVAGASSFTIAGFALDALSVHGGAGRGRIEDCVLSGVETSGPEPGCALRSIHCTQLLVARSIISGLDTEFGGTPAMVVDHSTVAIVGCTVRGGDALPPPPGWCGFNGSPGLTATSSYVIAAVTDILGGDGGPPSILSSSCYGNGGIGLICEDSLVDLRECGVAPGDPDIQFSGTPAPPLSASGGIVIGYVDGLFTGGAVSIIPPVPLPTARLDTSVAPGGSGVLWLLGPIFEPGLLLITIDGSIASVGHYEGPLWIVPQPTLMVPFLSPQAIQFTLPASPSLSGLDLTLQAIYPGLPGVLDPADIMTSNPDQLVIRF